MSDIIRSAIRDGRRLRQRCGSARATAASTRSASDPLAAGRKDGVTEQSHAEIAHVECMVVGVSERSTKCKVKLTPDQVKVAGTKIRVRF
jgi:hypothetical protein